MGKKSITRKVSVNKRTKQLSITIPKKEAKKLNPRLRFGEDLFDKLTILNKKRK